MRRSSRAELAARNNAVWCDTVCRAHGLAGEFLDSVWVHRRPSPPYYPNLITLRDTRDPTAAIHQIRELIDFPLQGAWGVKDSFRTLDLEEPGFDLLFEASWIWLESFKPIAESSEIRWRSVVSSAELAMWEAAGSASSGSPVVVDKPRQFPASLLADRDIVIFAGYNDQELVAGGIANHTDGVVGLSNVFSRSSDEFSIWVGLVSHVQRAFPGKPVVGYEEGRGLETAQACGFEAVGALRVWLRRVSLTR